LNAESTGLEPATSAVTGRKITLKCARVAVNEVRF
jgi:hypothetical protein